MLQPLCEKTTVFRAQSRPTKPNKFSCLTELVLVFVRRAFARNHWTNKQTKFRLVGRSVLDLQDLIGWQMGVTSPAAAGGELLVGRTSSRHIHRLGTSRGTWSPPRVPTGALYGPVDPPRRRWGCCRPYRHCRLQGLRGLVLEQLRQHNRLTGRFFCAYGQVLGVLGPLSPQSCRYRPTRCSAQEHIGHCRAPIWGVCGS